MSYFCLSDGMHDLVRPWMSSLPASTAGGDRSAALGHYGPLFELARTREAQPSMSIDLVGIAAGRMFATPVPLPGPSSDQGVYQVVEAESFDGCADQALLPRGQQYVLPGIYNHEISVLNHYLRTQPTRDLLLFLGIALDMGVVESRALALFLARDVWVTHPAIGVVPETFFVETMASLEAVALACAEATPGPPSDRPDHALVRSIEVLHSLLLMRTVLDLSRSAFTINPLVKVNARSGQAEPLPVVGAIDLTASRGGLRSGGGAAGGAHCFQ